MAEDGTMASGKSLSDFVKKHDLKLISIADLIEYRRKREKLVRRRVTVDMPTKYGSFKLLDLRNVCDISFLRVGKPILTIQFFFNSSILELFNIHTALLEKA